MIAHDFSVPPTENFIGNPWGVSQKAPAGSCHENQGVSSLWKRQKESFSESIKMLNGFYFIMAGTWLSERFSSVWSAYLLKRFFPAPSIAAWGSSRGILQNFFTLLLWKPFSALKDYTLRGARTSVCVPVSSRIHFHLNWWSLGWKDFGHTVRALWHIIYCVQTSAISTGSTTLHCIIRLANEWQSRQ